LRLERDFANQRSDIKGRKFRTGYINRNDATADRKNRPGYYAGASFDLKNDE